MGLSTINSRLLISLCIGATSVACYSVDEVQSISYKLNIYTNTASNKLEIPPNELPSNWVSGIDSQNFTYMAMANTISRRRNQAGTHTVNQWGEGDFLLRVKTEREIKPTLMVKFNLGTTAAVESTGFFSGVTTSSQGICGFAKTPVVVTSGDSTTTVEKSSGPTRGLYTYKNLVWENLGPLIKMAPILMPMKKLIGNASIYVPSGSGSNAVAAVAQASCLQKFKAESISFPTASVGGVTGTYNGFGQGGINYSLLNKNNGLIGTAFSQIIDANTNTSPLEFEIYPSEDDLSNLNRNPELKLVFQRESSLRKAFSFVYNPNAGISGIQIDLKYGDFDGDNEIEADEVNAIPNYYGLTENDTAFHTNVANTNHLVSDLDVNKDGAITAADYLLVLPNIGLIGD